MAPLRSVIIVESFSIPPLPLALPQPPALLSLPSATQAPSPGLAVSQALRETSDIQTAILAGVAHGHDISCYVLLALLAIRKLQGFALLELKPDDMCDAALPTSRRIQIMPCYPDSAEFVSPKQESFPYDTHQLGHEKKKIECRSKAEAPLSHFPATYPKYRPPRSFPP